RHLPPGARGLRHPGLSELGMGGRASTERFRAAHRGAGRAYRLLGPKCSLGGPGERRGTVASVVKIGRGSGGRGTGAAPFSETRKIMGRFDSRSTTKIRQRKAQAKKKARDARRAEETRAARQ